MSKKNLWVFFIVLVFSLCSIYGLAQNESLVLNPDFELSSEYVRFWETYQWGRILK